MTLAELMNQVIADGIESVLANETRPEKRRGGVAGFELCRGLLTLEEFEALLVQRHKTEENLRWAGVTEENKDDYWEHRTATAQVEWCYEIMRVAFRKTPLSARAAMKYQSLLEKADEKANGGVAS